MRGLEGRTVAVLETRRSAELGALIRQLGGIPIGAESVREVERPDDLARFAAGLAADRFDLIAFLTGTGVEAVLADAARRDALDAALAKLRAMPLACRGPKPVGVLKRHGLVPALTTVKPHTSQELLDALGRLPLAGRRVGVVHYGEHNPGLSAALAGAGALVDDICAYEWRLPEDVEPLRALVGAVAERRVDALLVTSQIQYRHACDIAGRSDQAEAWHDALRRDVVVGAIGPVCADAIRSTGVVPDVMPPVPNLPSLVRALGDYFELVVPGGAASRRRT